MAMQLTHVNVWVNDQDEALAFYTQKLGMELRDDITLPEMGGFRWLTVGPVGQPDVALTLMTGARAAGVRRGDVGQLKELVAKGRVGALFFRTDDCRREYEELKGRGVEFTEEPTERPYGIDAGFRDDSGNQMRLVQM